MHMHVCFIPADTIPADAESVEHYVQDGILTTDHPASCYGQPIIVGTDAVAYGPGDCYESGYAGVAGAPRDMTLEDAAERSGWVREPNHRETDTTY